MTPTVARPVINGTIVHDALVHSYQQDLHKIEEKAFVTEEGSQGSGALP